MGFITDSHRPRRRRPAAASRTALRLSAASVLLLGTSPTGAFRTATPCVSSGRRTRPIDGTSRSRDAPPLSLAYLDQTYNYNGGGLTSPKSAELGAASATRKGGGTAAPGEEQERAPARSKPPSALPNGGRVTLVGAGPGSPDLLTVAALRVITDPDNFLIVDRLVSDEILGLIEGEYRVANKNPGCQATAQEEIYEWCLEGLREGRHVVRLKIGDPFVFGRGGEEVLEFRDFGVEPAVIPGVSAAFSAPLLGSIPVTHRGVSNQVVMCTGYGRDNTSPDLIQYQKEQTVVFLMAVGRLRTLCDNLHRKANFPIDTPVAIVERAGCPDQRTVVGTMESIADIAEANNVRPPSTIVVGEVVNVLLTEDDFVREVDSATQEGLIQTVA